MILALKTDVKLYYQIGNKERASTILIAQLWKPVTNVDCFDLEAD